MSKSGLIIAICPTCGSGGIRKIRGDWKGSHMGKAYSVRSLEYYSCPDCGEKVYPPEAMRRIEETSPAYVKMSRHAVREAPKPGTRASG